MSFFLVGYVENYFQKFSFKSYEGKSCVTKKVVNNFLGLTISETIKCETIRQECETNYTRSFNLKMHLVWKHGRLCHPPQFS